jgi:hypothetical protein
MIRPDCGGSVRLEDAIVSVMIGVGIIMVGCVVTALDGPIDGVSVCASDGFCVGGAVGKKYHR